MSLLVDILRDKNVPNAVLTWREGFVGFVSWELKTVGLSLPVLGGHEHVQEAPVIHFPLCSGTLHCEATALFFLKCLFFYNSAPQNWKIRACCFHCSLYLRCPHIRVPGFNIHLCPDSKFLLAHTLGEHR